MDAADGRLHGDGGMLDATTLDAGSSPDAGGRDAATQDAARASDAAPPLDAPSADVSLQGDSGTIDASLMGDAAVFDAVGFADVGTSPSLPEQGWTTYGYDLANSQTYPFSTRIRRDTLSALSPKWRIQVGVGATSTPMVADGTVYFGAWDGFFYAVDSTTAALAWKVHIGQQFVRSSPLVTDDVVYIGADRSLFALRRSDGGVIFETELIQHPQGFVESSPKLADGVIVIGRASYEPNVDKDDYTFEGSVVGIDAETGALLWEIPTTGQEPGPCQGGSGVSVWSTAAIDRELGLAYIGTGNTYEAPASTCNDSLLAFHYRADHSGDRLAWKATYTEGDVYVATNGGLNGLDHDIGAGPNLFMAGEVAAVGAGDKGGTYRAFNRQTGELLWRADLEHGTNAQLGGVMTTAAVSRETVFVTSNIWRRFGFVSSGTHSPLDRSTLYALHAETGVERWRVDLDAPVFGTFAISGDVLFHATIRGDLYARDVDTGDLLWMSNIGAPIGAGISLSQEGLYTSGGFSHRGTSEIGYVIGYSVAPSSFEELDFREDTYKELTFEECSDTLSELHADETCRTCLCECDPSTTGACQVGCWELASCIVDNCGDKEFPSVDARGCFEEFCSSKLLPPNVHQESVRSARCVIECVDSCDF